MKNITDTELEAAPLLIKDLLQEVLRTARDSLGMELAFISEFAGGYRTFRLVDAEPDLSGVLKVEDSDPLENSFCQRVVDGRLPSLIQNAIDLEVARKLQVTMSLPVGAHLSVPLTFEDGTLYGTFCCFSRQPDYTLSEKDLDAITAFSKLASILLKFFVAEDHERLERHRRVIRLIEHQQFFPVYQPIVRLADRTAVGFEALTRFESPAGLTTEEWFNEASNVGAGYALECAAGKLALQGLDLVAPEQYITINLSPETILSCPNLEELVGRDPERLVLEITEHRQIDDYLQLAQALADLRARGLRLAVDDAGAGYASFRHILQLQPDIIKIDRSLVRGVDQDPAQLALAGAIVSFAQSTRTSIVAEGVETESELETLTELGVTHAQGYLLGRPARLHTP